MPTDPVSPRGAAFVFNGRELNGALGDLGTLLPLMLGVLAVGGVSPGPVGLKTVGGRALRPGLLTSSPLRGMVTT